MSGWHGPAGRGARASLRQAKRDEAEARNRLTPPERRAKRGTLACVTGKVRFASEREARTELVGALIAKNRGKTQRQECRTYACDLCNGHHLTSSPLRPQTKETTR